jgi:hypothetical protein
MSDPAYCESTLELPPIPSSRFEAELSKEEIARRRQARRQANRLAGRFAEMLGVHWLLTPAPARAFFEMIRKFTKDHREGREPVYDRPRECLADDAGVSVSAFDQMRRVAVDRGWISSSRSGFCA